MSVLRLCPKFIALLCLVIVATASPIDMLLGREYHGQYEAHQAGVVLHKIRKALTTWMSGAGKSP